MPWKPDSQRRASRCAARPASTWAWPARACRSRTARPATRSSAPTSPRPSTTRPPPGGIAVEHGKRLVDVVEPPGDGVRALFEDGSKATGEVLVGADGIHLVARRRIDPNAPAATYAGLINLGGYARGVHVDAEPGPVPPGSPEERDQNHVIEALEEVRRLGWPTGLSAFLRASELGKIAMLICGFPAR